MPETPEPPEPPLSAPDSDPNRLGWMQGSPPPPEKRVAFADGSFYRFPQLRWAFSNQRRLIPTRNISRGLGTALALPRAERGDIDALRFETLLDQRPMSWAEGLQAVYTDGIVVLHRGAIVYERYFGALGPAGQHIAFSVTKSLVGLLAATLVAEGRLDEMDMVGRLVPELQASGFGDASVRDLLDMQLGLRYGEDYADPQAEVWQHARAGLLIPRPADYAGPQSFHEFLQTVQKEGAHGRAMAYKTINTDALAWVVARVTGSSLADALSERLWSRLGAEQDAYISMDGSGTEFAGGGLSTGLRDLARVGEMMRNGGRVGGQQVVPESVVNDVRCGGNRAKFPQASYPLLAGWSYRSQWWHTHNAHGAYMARGIHGQCIYVDEPAQMVIARYASNPLAANSANDVVTQPAFAALSLRLMGG